jgi:rSAM/selenodomain-associated transferase 1
VNVHAVIPALDEEASIGAVVRQIPRSLVRSVIVADNGSRDRTADEARAAGAVVVSEPRRGYGSACLAALAALPPDCDVVVFLDADGSDDVTALPRLLAPILEGRADFVVGSRVAAGPQVLTWTQRAGNALACAWLRRRFGIRATDLGPFRAIRREALARLGMKDRTYGWTVEMQIKAAKQKLRYDEVQVAPLPRRTGKSKVSGTLRGIVGASWKILGLLFRHDLFARRSGAAAPKAIGSDELIVFLKLPEPGRVKTRLFPAIGPEAAAKLHRALVERTLARVARPGAPWTTVLCFDPPGGAAALRAWLGPGFEARAQPAGDLGVRLETASREAFAGGARRIAFIGTDAPDLDASDVAAAFAALDRADVAIAPALDGGYALIAMKAHQPALFRDVAWSSADTARHTLERAREAGLAVTTLRTLADVDRPEDLVVLPPELRPDEAG